MGRKGRGRRTPKEIRGTFLSDRNLYGSVDFKGASPLLIDAVVEANRYWETLKFGRPYERLVPYQDSISVRVRGSFSLLQKFFPATPPLRDLGQNPTLIWLWSGVLTAHSLVQSGELDQLIESEAMIELSYVLSRYDVIRQKDLKALEPLIEVIDDEFSSFGSNPWLASLWAELIHLGEDARWFRDDDFPWFVRAPRVQRARQFNVRVPPHFTQQLIAESANFGVRDGVLFKHWYRNARLFQREHLDEDVAMDALLDNAPDIESEKYEMELSYEDVHDFSHLR